MIKWNQCCSTVNYLGKCLEEFGIECYWPWRDAWQRWIYSYRIFSVIVIYVCWCKKFSWGAMFWAYYCRPTRGPKGDFRGWCSKGKVCTCVRHQQKQQAVWSSTSCVLTVWILQRLLYIYSLTCKPHWHMHSCPLLSQGYVTVSHHVLVLDKQGHILRCL